MKKILFYTNQFFGQIGGEDMAYAEPQLFEGMHGSANTFGAPLKDIAEIVATIVCGDNFYAENMETGRAFLLEQIKKYQPDLIIAGPAFNAGRFGIACGDVCKTAKEQAGVEAITGLYEENPAVDMFKKDVYILRVGKSAAGIRKAVPLMAGFARKLLTGEPIGTPEDEQYYAKGKRAADTIFNTGNNSILYPCSPGCTTQLCHTPCKDLFSTSCPNGTTSSGKLGLGVSFLDRLNMIGAVKRTFTASPLSIPGFHLGIRPTTRNASLSR